MSEQEFPQTWRIEKEDGYIAEIEVKNEDHAFLADRAGFKPVPGKKKPASN